MTTVVRFPRTAVDARQERQTKAERMLAVYYEGVIRREAAERALQGYGYSEDEAARMTGCVDGLWLDHHSSRIRDLKYTMDGGI